MSKFFALLICCVVFSVIAQAQLSPEAVQQSTREWIQHKLKHRAPSDVAAGNMPPNIAKGGGENTNISQSENPESEVHAAINPLDTNNIIAATMRYSPDGAGSFSLSFPIYYTLDFGETWQQSSFDPAELGFLELLAGGGDPVLAFTPDGTAHLTWLIATLSIFELQIKFTLYHATSQDKGVTWQRSSEALDGGGLDILGSTGRLVDKEWLSVDDNPTSPYYGNLYAAYTDLNLTDTIAHYRILMRAWDAGTGFAEPVVAVDSVQFFISQFGVPTVATNGDVHLMWLGASYEDFYLGLFHTMSTDGGQNFSDPQLVSYVNVPCFPPMSSTSPCIPGISQDRTFSSNYLVAGNTPETAGHLYAVWSANGFQDELTPGFDVYFAKSEDGGASWAAPVVLNQDGMPDIHNFLPNINLSPDGLLSICWYDQRDAPNGSLTNYYCVTSEDGGNTFSDDFIVSSQATDFLTVGNANEEFGVGEYNATVSTPNQLIPFWADGRSNNGNLDIYCAKIPFQNLIPTSIRPLGAANITLRVFPNPTHDQVSVYVAAAEAPLNNCKAYLANSTGQIIREFDMPDTIAGTHAFDIALAGLSSGNYFFILDFGQKKWMEKIILRAGNK